MTTYYTELCKDYKDKLKVKGRIQNISFTLSCFLFKSCVFTLFLLFAQINNDARMIGLNGAYTPMNMDHTMNECYICILKFDTKLFY